MDDGHGQSQGPGPEAPRGRSFDDVLLENPDISELRRQAAATIDRLVEISRKPTTSKVVDPTLGAEIQKIQIRIGEIVDLVSVRAGTETDGSERQQALFIILQDLMPVFGQIFVGLHQARVALLKPPALLHSAMIREALVLLDRVSRAPVG